MASRFPLLVLLLMPFAPVLAQTDSVAAGDTIGLKTQWVFFSRIRQYSYHGADRLTDRQVARLLRQSPDTAARRLARQSLNLRNLTTGLMLGGYGAALGGLATVVRQPQLSGVLLLSGLVSFYGGLIPRGTANRRVRQARDLYNLYVRSRAGDYFNPLLDLSPDASELTLADTVGVGRFMGLPRFTYRNLRGVAPAAQLNRLFDRLGDEGVRGRMRYSRTVRGVGGFIGGVGVGFLSAYVTSLAVRQNFTRRSFLINPRIPAIAFGGVGAALLIRLHADGAEARALQRYNAVLRQRSDRAY